MVGAVERVETICATVWTGVLCLHRLETPLDDVVERLRPEFYYAQLRKFR
jgi:hypothetical protein